MKYHDEDGEWEPAPFWKFFVPAAILAGVFAGLLAVAYVSLFRIVTGWLS